MNDIVLLVDRSGSMNTILTSTLSGLNEFVGAQRLLPNTENTHVTLHIFDEFYDTPITKTPLASFPTLTEQDISPRGMTALYDAIGRMLAEMPITPAIVVIVTDGVENASKQFTKTQVMDQVTERRRLGWTFIFLAANQDAIASGIGIGIPQHTACTFDTTPEHVSAVFRGASNALARAHTDGTPVEIDEHDRTASSASQCSDTFDENMPPPMLRREPSMYRGQTDQ